MGKVTVGTLEMNDLVRAMVDARGIASVAALRSATLAAEYVTGEVRAAIFESVGKNPGPGSVRTGALARSFKPEVEVAKSGRIEARTVSSLSYARIQNDGGFIRPKRKFLAIPMTRMAAGRWPRTFRRGDLQYIFNRASGKHLLVDAGALKRGKVNVVFLLKRRVKLPGLHYLDKAYRTGLPVIVGFFHKGVGKIVDRIVF